MIDHSELDEILDELIARFACEALMHWIAREERAQDQELISRATAYFLA